MNNFGRLSLLTVVIYLCACSANNKTASLAPAPVQNYYYPYANQAAYSPDLDAPIAPYDVHGHGF